MSGRKYYLDNIRWATILLVVVYHVFFYFNNVGVTAIFPGLPAYRAGETVRPDALYQYMVYPWFMVLLFVVAGIASRAALGKKPVGRYLRGRACKLLAPSVLGVLCFGWISGHIVSGHSAGDTLNGIPRFVRWIIDTCAGIGALWFCQLLFAATLCLLAIRALDKKLGKGRERLCALAEKCALPLLFLAYFILWGAGQVANMPVVLAYRFGFYTAGYLLGYYLFAQDRVMNLLKKWRFALLAAAMLSGLYFALKTYGTYYAAMPVLKAWYTNLFAYLAVLAILGLGAQYFGERSALTDFCTNNSFAVYVLHIPVLLVTLQLLEGLALPMPLRYLLALAAALILSLGLGRLIGRVPVLRFVVLGIKSTKKRTKNKAAAAP